MKTLTDTDPMPCGLRKGTPMQDMSAEYLYGFWPHSLKKDTRCPVAEYIRQNLTAFQERYPQGEW